MCLATPMQIKRIEKEYGFLVHGGKEYRVELSLIDNPKVGDWILAHGELAVSKVPCKDAKEILELISQAGVNH
ncbi:MAG: HypC/HybG/HupF family hydrogenase formation chaperone [bacterium]